MENILPDLLLHVRDLKSLVAKHCPSLANLCAPKEYASKQAYGELDLTTLQAFTAISSITNGSREILDENRVQVLSYLICSKLIRYQMPTFYVSEELCEALLKTSAPTDLRFSEIQFPMPAMMFMLPLDFSMCYFEDRVDYLLLGRFEANETCKYPCGLNGPAPSIDIPSDGVGFSMIPHLGAAGLDIGDDLFGAAARLTQGLLVWLADLDPKVDCSGKLPFEAIDPAGGAGSSATNVYSTFAHPCRATKAVTMVSNVIPCKGSWG